MKHQLMLKQNNISPGRNHANRCYTNGDGVAGSTCLFFTFTCHWDTTLVDWDQI